MLSSDKEHVDAETLKVERRENIQRFCREYKELKAPYTKVSLYTIYYFVNFLLF